MQRKAEQPVNETREDSDSDSDSSGSSSSDDDSSDDDGVLKIDGLTPEQQVRAFSRVAG